MLKITQELLSSLKQKNTEPAVMQSQLKAILSCGNKTDAAALLDYYLANPSDNHTDYMLEIFSKWGDAEFAQKIFNSRIADNKLVDEDAPEMLELLGQLKFELVKPVLIHYAFSESSDHYLHKYAVLGLLHFNCDELAELIEQKIEETIGKNLFAEFIPALVCKLKQPEALLARLFESGRDYCSTDCNAGIIVGFSLCGEVGKTYLYEVLFDESWEADATATGTAYFTYRGLINQQISLVNLAQLVITQEDERKQKQGLQVMFSMLNIRVNDYTENVIDTFQDIYVKLFEWGSDLRLFNLAEKYELTDTFYQLFKLVEIKLNEEMILKSVK